MRQRPSAAAGPSGNLIGRFPRLRTSGLVLHGGLKSPLTHRKFQKHRSRIPFVLEFLDLKDEYSEAELEEALIRELEQFLLELT
jgi:hypothetical protein